MEEDVAARAAAQVWSDGRMCFAAAGFFSRRCPRVTARLIALGAKLVQLARAWEQAAVAEGRLDNRPAPSHS